MSENRRHADETIASQRLKDIAAQFPELLDETEQGAIGERVENLVGAITRLRATPLSNRDELAIAFRPIGKEQT